jgi:enterochelin esterase-like enzyme
MQFTSRLFIVVAAAMFAVSCDDLRDAPATTDRALETVIADIEAGLVTTPIVEQPAPGTDATVTFLVHSADGQTPRIVSDVTGWGESPDDSYFDLSIGTMVRVDSDDWFQLETRVAPRARIEYLVVHGETDYRVDPNNPRRAWSRGDYEMSEFVTPDYVPPPELADPPVTPIGSSSEYSIDSRALGAPRRAIVYLPPGYRADGTYPVAVFHSGWGVAREGQATRILDWLITRGLIQPIVGLFLESYLPGDVDNHEGPPLRSYLSDEAPAWLAAHASVSTDADDWAVLAISYGAQDALDAALAPNHAFGRLGLLIPGRRLTPTKIEEIVGHGGHRLCVAILAGRYDQANLTTAQNAAQALTDAGHAVDLIEVPEGHNPTTWRNHLSNVFVSLFGERKNLP